MLYNGTADPRARPDVLRPWSATTTSDILASRLSRHALRRASRSRLKSSSGRAPGRGRLQDSRRSIPCTGSSTMRSSHPFSRARGRERVLKAAGRRDWKFESIEKVNPDWKAFAAGTDQFVKRPAMMAAMSFSRVPHALQRLDAAAQMRDPVPCGGATTDWLADANSGVRLLTGVPRLQCSARALHCARDT